MRASCSRSGCSSWASAYGIGLARRTAWTFGETGNGGEERALRRGGGSRQQRPRRAAAAAHVPPHRRPSHTHATHLKAHVFHAHELGFVSNNYSPPCVRGRCARSKRREKMHLLNAPSPSHPRSRVCVCGPASAPLCVLPGAAAHHNPALVARKFQREPTTPRSKNPRPQTPITNPNPNPTPKPLTDCVLPAAGDLNRVVSGTAQTNPPRETWTPYTHPKLPTP